MEKLTREEISKKLPQTGFMLLPELFSIHPGVEEGAITIGTGKMELREENDWLKNHFGIAPGIMLIEFLNQTAALTAICHNNLEGKLPVVLRLQDESPKFGNEPVIAGDKLIAKAKLLKSRGGMFFFKGSVYKSEGPIVLTTGIVGAAVEKEALFKKSA